MIGLFERMKTMMMERMSGQLSPQEMQAMMAEMMGRMVAAMPLEERVSFMQSMLGTCVPQMTAGLEPAEQARVAEAVLGRLGDKLRQLAGASREL